LSDAQQLSSTLRKFIVTDLTIQYSTYSLVQASMAFAVSANGTHRAAGAQDAISAACCACAELRCLLVAKDTPKQLQRRRVGREGTSAGVQAAGSMKQAPISAAVMQGLLCLLDSAEFFFGSSPPEETACGSTTLSWRF